LRNIVCMIIKDGDTYRFSHRTFQSYFAACYTSQNLTDEQQKTLFRSVLTNSSTAISNQDYFDLLNQIEPDRFAINAFEDKLKQIISEASSNPNPEMYVMRLITNVVSIGDYDGQETFFSRVPMEPSRIYNYNVLSLFERYLIKPYRVPDYQEKIELLKNYNSISEDIYDEIMYRFDQIDETESITAAQKQEFYTIVCHLLRIPTLIAGISSWLKHLEEKRALLAKPNFIDEL